MMLIIKVNTMNVRSVNGRGIARMPLFFYQSLRVYLPSTYSLDIFVILLSLHIYVLAANTKKFSKRTFTIHYF